MWSPGLADVLGTEPLGAFSITSPVLRITSASLGKCARTKDRVLQPTCSSCLPAALKTEVVGQLGSQSPASLGLPAPQPHHAPKFARILVVCWFPLTLFHLLGSKTLALIRKTGVKWEFCFFSVTHEQPIFLQISTSLSLSPPLVPLELLSQSPLYFPGDWLFASWSAFSQHSQTGVKPLFFPWHTPSFAPFCPFKHLPQGYPGKSQCFFTCLWGMGYLNNFRIYKGLPFFLRCLPVSSISSSACPEIYFLKSINNTYFNIKYLDPSRGRFKHRLSDSKPRVGFAIYYDYISSFPDLLSQLPHYLGLSPFRHRCGRRTWV